MRFINLVLATMLVSSPLLAETQDTANETADLFSDIFGSATDSNVYEAVPISATTSTVPPDAAAQLVDPAQLAAIQFPAQDLPSFAYDFPLTAAAYGGAPPTPSVQFADCMMQYGDGELCIRLYPPPAPERKESKGGLDQLLPLLMMGGFFGGQEEEPNFAYEEVPMPQLPEIKQEEPAESEDEDS